MFAKRSSVEITKDTKVSEILRKYGDIAEVMELFGVKRVGDDGDRRGGTSALTQDEVEGASRDG